MHIEADALNAALDDFAKKDKGPRAPIWWPTGNGSSTNQDFADHDGSKAAQSHRPNITRAA